MSLLLLFYCLIWAGKGLEQEYLRVLLSLWTRVHVQHTFRFHTPAYREWAVSYSCCQEPVGADAARGCPSREGPRGYPSRGGGASLSGWPSREKPRGQPSFSGWGWPSLEPLRDSSPHSGEPRLLLVCKGRAWLNYYN